MNKMDLVDGMAKRARITKTEANKALDALTDMVAKALRDGEKVTQNMLIGRGRSDGHDRGVQLAAGRPGQGV